MSSHHAGRSEDREETQPPTAGQWRDLIEPLFLRLVAARSDTNTPFEGVIEELILAWLKGRDYFCAHPELVGTHLLPEDVHRREVVWALVKGKGRRTIVLIHHHDAVDLNGYGRLTDLALRPDDLAAAMADRRIGKQARADLESGQWIFGRGTADMKSGAAIQLALLDRISTDPDLQGNYLLLSVPDEESLSQGMLAAVELMQSLASTHGLEYVLTINSEPYFNHVKSEALMYEGSVGKVMPIVYVRGVKSHVGDPFKGVNPSLILATLQRLTELNIDLCDQAGDDATPPPVWVNLKDRKRAYDASIPEAATGYFNWLTFTKSPADLMSQMLTLSQRALDETLAHRRQSYLRFCQLNDDEIEEDDFEPRVLPFGALYDEALLAGGQGFLDRYQALQDDVGAKAKRNEITLPEGAIRLLEFTAEEADLEGPSVVVGFSGPYYPHVTNGLLPGGERYALRDRVDALSQNLYGVRYTSKSYFMGISDLSYAAWAGDDRAVEAIKAHSPGWDGIYRIPFSAIRGLSAPVLNLGPWGKDLHMPTERVYAADVYERIPEILYRLTRDILAEAAT